MEEKELICKIHKKYRGIQKPRSVCLDCWRIWLRNNPKEIVDAKMMEKIIESSIEKYLDSGWDI